MNKAVYVFKHMPDSCEGCFKIYRNGACILADGDRWVEEPSKRPDWCPLRELPDHMADYNPEIHPANEPFDAGYTLGWNECLNQIEGDNTDE